ncbi:unnamed protein product [Brachionus calyciflorus]|uniref:Uncharacterized protein n=1 Tax=Brachionus calyciflorus TaxID=104777 RepID=A0A814BIB3_9BILA|nr:unnamed protein product [Brachionus calyciflorus]
MDYINCSVHFLTLKQIGYEESNVAVTFYHDRTHFDQNQKNLYAQYAEDFNLQQGRHFVLHNRVATMPNKMSKLKDQVKEFDLLLSSVKIIKIMWLNQNRLLLITESSNLIWLVIDPVSGDLIKILIDKSLDNLKLSSKKLSDLQFMTPEGSMSSILIISYSDKSKLDLIKFKKSTQFFDFFQKLSTLEKLENFDPFLVQTYEFTCPEVGYPINKYILLDSKYQFFTIWWSNQIELVNQRSLLDRDDLRNNILILSSNLTDPNLLEYMFKSDGLLLAVDYIEDNLVSVEQVEYINNQKYSITIFKCLIKDPKNQDDFKPVKLKLKSFYLKAKVLKVNIYGLFILILCEDQTIILYDYYKNLVKKVKLNWSDWNQIEWIKENLFFSVLNQNGDLKLYDIGLNEIDLKYATRYFIKFQTLSEYLNDNLFTRNGSNRIELFSNSKKNMDSNWSCFLFSKGPFGLFKVDLPNDFNSLNLINLYLKSYKLSNDFIKKSINLYLCLDWNRVPIECLGSLQKILNILLSNRVVFNNEIEELCERVFKGFYKPKRELKQDVILEYRAQVSKYARKFFYVLIKNCRFENALRLADDIGDRDLFSDLFYSANDEGEYQMAEVCRLKFHESKHEESKELLKNELNRSVNTIDDNLKGNYSEIDRYSVSSSEQSSSAESYCGSLGSDIGDLDEGLDISLKFSKRNIKMSSKNEKPKVYTEEEIENFTRKMIEKNKFIYEIAFN